MKKMIILAAVLMAAMLMSGCQKSTISAVDDNPLGLEGNINVNPGETVTMTMHATEAYTIPEGATGPADVSVEDPQNYYPEGFKTEELGDVVQILFYYVNSTGLHPEFTVAEGKECTPEMLIQSMVDEGVLAEGTEIMSSKIDGDNAEVELNWLLGCTSSATQELLAQAVANTFIDNLNLETVTVKEYEGKTFGPLEHKD